MFLKEALLCAGSSSPLSPSSPWPSPPQPLPRPWPARSRSPRGHNGLGCTKASDS